MNITSKNNSALVMVVCLSVGIYLALTVNLAQSRVTQIRYAHLSNCICQVNQ